MRRSQALNFVTLLGVVSLFADMMYEGARSAIGPFLGMLGASAFAIGVVSGGRRADGLCIASLVRAAGRSHTPLLGDHICRVRAQSAGGTAPRIRGELADGCDTRDLRAHGQGAPHPGS